MMNSFPHNVGMNLDEVEPKSALLNKVRLDHEAALLKRQMDFRQYTINIMTHFPCVQNIHRDIMIILNALSSHRIDTPGAVWRVLNLFHGHDDFIIGFTQFLPTGCSIEILPNEVFNLYQPGQPVITMSVPSDIPVISRTSDPRLTSTECVRRAVTLKHTSNNKSPSNNAEVNPGEQPYQPAVRRYRSSWEYMSKVKEKSHIVPFDFMHYLFMHAEFNSQQVDTLEMVKQVNGLFRGDTELMVGFNECIQDGHWIEVQPNGVINLHKEGQAVINISAGDQMNLLESGVQEMQLDFDAGQVKLCECGVEGLELDLNAGQVKLCECGVEGLQLDLNAGHVKQLECGVEELQLESNAGHVKLLECGIEEMQLF